MEQFIVSARKYRPDSFETLLGQDNIARTLKNSIERGQLAHAYLFCGPRGVGKTSSARIFAKVINCSNPGEGLEPCGECESCRSFAENRSFNIHELDAASNNSVDDIRTLTDQVRIPPQIGKYSVFIIDEVHMLSQAAFNAFLKTLEEPPAHAIFILATTEKHKILPTILSRCQTYDFNRISIDDMVRNISLIAAKEGVEISEDAMHIIAQKADGAMRDALTLFDQTVAFCGKKVSYEQVIKNLNVLDYDYYFKLTDDVLSGEYAQAMLTFDEILSKGFNAQGFIAGMCSHFRDLIVCKNNAAQTLLELAPTIAEKYKNYAAKCRESFLFDALGICSACDSSYRQSANPRLLIEFALMKLCNLNGAFVAAASTAAPVSAPKVAGNPTPVKEPAPVPAPVVSKPTGLSIKAVMEEIESVPDNTVAAIDTEQKEVTQEMVEQIWPSFAESEAQMPRLSSAIAQSHPVLSGNDIHFTVGNQAQKEWIDRTCRARMEGFLRKKLQSGHLTLVIDVPEAPASDVSALHMPSDKVNYLEKNSEEFKALRDDFKLETS